MQLEAPKPIDCERLQCSWMVVSLKGTTLVKTAMQDNI